MDSGAGETVIHPEMLSSIKLEDGEQKRRGVKYEVASGEMIPNLGEKRFRWAQSRRSCKRDRRAGM